jgi:hypothetical protein
MWMQHLLIISSSCFLGSLQVLHFHINDEWIEGTKKKSFDAMM